ncbi:treslin isoform X1 [Lampetra fluviatilis]
MPTTPPPPSPPPGCRRRSGKKSALSRKELDFEDEDAMASRLSQDYVLHVADEGRALPAFASSAVAIVCRFLKAQGASDVERRCATLLRDKLLRDGRQLRQRRLGGGDDGGVSSSPRSRTRECCLQSLLRLEMQAQFRSLECDDDNIVDEVTDLLRTISLTMDPGFLNKFLSEEVLDRFASRVPRVLGALYSNLGQDVPRSLRQMLPDDFFSEDSPSQEDEDDDDGGAAPASGGGAGDLSVSSSHRSEIGERRSRSRVLVRHPSVCEAVQSRRQIEVPSRAVRKERSLRSGSSVSSAPVPTAPDAAKAETSEDVTTKVRRSLFSRELSSPGRKRPRSQQQHGRPGSSRGAVKLLTRQVAETPSHKQCSQRLLKAQVKGREHGACDGTSVTVVQESPCKPLHRAAGTQDVRRSPRLHSRRSSFYAASQPLSRAAASVSTQEAAAAATQGSQAGRDRSTSPHKAAASSSAAPSPRKLLFAATQQSPDAIASDPRPSRHLAGGAFQRDGALSGRVRSPSKLSRRLFAPSSASAAATTGPRLSPPPRPSAAPSGPPRASAARSRRTRRTPSKVRFESSSTTTTTTEPPPRSRSPRTPTRAPGRDGGGGEGPARVPPGTPPPCRSPRFSRGFPCTPGTPGTPVSSTRLPRRLTPTPRTPRSGHVPGTPEAPGVGHVARTPRTPRTPCTPRTPRTPRTPLTPRTPRAVSMERGVVPWTRPRQSPGGKDTLATPPPSATAGAGGRRAPARCLPRTRSECSDLLRSPLMTPAKRQLALPPEFPGGVGEGRDERPKGRPPAPLGGDAGAGKTLARGSRESPPAPPRVPEHGVGTASRAPAPEIRRSPRRSPRRPPGMFPGRSPGRSPGRCPSGGGAGAGSRVETARGDGRRSGSADRGAAERGAAERGQEPDGFASRNAARGGRWSEEEDVEDEEDVDNVEDEEDDALNETTLSSSPAGAGSLASPEWELASPRGKREGVGVRLRRKATGTGGAPAETLPASPWASPQASLLTPPGGGGSYSLRLTVDRRQRRAEALQSSPAAVAAGAWHPSATKDARLQYEEEPSPPALLPRGSGPLEPRLKRAGSWGLNEDGRERPRAPVGDAAAASRHRCGRHSSHRRLAEAGDQRTPPSCRARRASASPSPRRVQTRICHALTPPASSSTPPQSAGGAASAASPAQSPAIRRWPRKKRAGGGASPAAPGLKPAPWDGGLGAAEADGVFALPDGSPPREAAWGARWSGGAGYGLGSRWGGSGGAGFGLGSGRKRRAGRCLSSPVEEEEEGGGGGAAVPWAAPKEAKRPRSETERGWSSPRGSAAFSFTTTAGSAAGGSDDNVFSSPAGGRHRELSARGLLALTQSPIIRPPPLLASAASTPPTEPTGGATTSSSNSSQESPPAELSSVRHRSPGARTYGKRKLPC